MISLILGIKTTTTTKKQKKCMELESRLIVSKGRGVEEMGEGGT